jgi:hypothetical protein
MFACVIAYLKQIGTLDPAISDMIVTMLGGYIGLNIINKIVTIGGKQA